MTKVYCMEEGLRKKKRMGRPLKTGKPLTKLVQLRLSDEELRDLKRKAKAKGLSVSEYLRQCGKELP